MNINYKHDIQKHISVFDGNLEEYLLEIGVPIDHINKMKEKILIRNRDSYYDYIHDTEKYGFVPLEKVVGVSRGTIGKSVFDNVREIFDGEREPARFQRIFEMSLVELKEFFVNCESVNMVYYEDDDEYFLIGDGNHRTLSAMLVGAEKIKARIITARCNHDLKKKYLYEDNLKKKYSIVGFYKGIFNNMDIVFWDEIGKYKVNNFQGKGKDEDYYEFIERLSINISSDLKKAAIIGRFPMLIQSIIFKICKNYRLEEYLRKKYLDKSRFGDNFLLKEIYLYKL